MATYSHAENPARPQPSKGHVWGTIGFIVLGYNIVIAALITIPAFLIPAMGAHLNLRDMSAVALTGALAGELLLFWWLVRHLHRTGRTLQDIGWRRKTTTVAIVAAILFGLLYAAHTLMSLQLLDDAKEVFTLFKFYGALVGVVGALVEECIFRGYILTELERIKTPVALQVAVSGVTFALIHSGFFDIGAILVTLAMGLVLALLYIYGRRSLTPTILSHALTNLIIEPWLIMFLTSVYAAKYSH